MVAVAVATVAAAEAVAAAVATVAVAATVVAAMAAVNATADRAATNASALSWIARVNSFSPRNSREQTALGRGRAIRSVVAPGLGLVPAEARRFSAYPAASLPHQLVISLAVGLPFA